MRYHAISCDIICVLRPWFDRHSVRRSNPTEASACGGRERTCRTSSNPNFQQSKLPAIQTSSNPCLLSSMRVFPSCFKGRGLGLFFWSFLLVFSSVFGSRGDIHFKGRKACYHLCGSFLLVFSSVFGSRQPVRQY